MAPKAKAKKEEVKAPAKGKGKKAAEVEAPVAEKVAKGKGKGKAVKEVVVKPTKGRGRVKGVKNVVSAKHAKEVQNKFAAMEEQFNTLAENVGAFLEKGNKSAVKDARINMMNVIRMGKDFRFALQEAKTNMVQESTAK